MDIGGRVESGTETEKMSGTYFRNTDDRRNFISS